MSKKSKDAPWVRLTDGDIKHVQVYNRIDEAIETARDEITAELGDDSMDALERGLGKLKESVADVAVEMIKKPVRLIELAVLRTDGGTQMRAEISKELLFEYRDYWLAGVEFPAIDVFFDGAIYWIADGFHRFYGAREARIRKLRCRVHQGTQRDAILFAAGANRAHGQRRTNADKRCAVLSLLNDAEWGAKSNRWIAEKCGVDDKTVASVRKESTAEIPQLRVGKDGKERAVKMGTTVPVLPGATVDAGPLQRAAELTGSSAEDIELAGEVIRHGSTELIVAAETAEVPLSVAAKVARTVDKPGQMNAAREMMNLAIEQRLADEYGVKPEQIRRDGEFADAVDIIAACAHGEEAKATILAGQSGLTLEEVVAIGKLECADLSNQVAQLASRKRPPRPEYESLAVAIEAFDKSLADVFSRWPEKYRAAFGEKLMMAAEEFRDTGSLRP